MTAIVILLFSPVPANFCSGQVESPIWLELTRTGIPIRRMSPKRLHSRTSHALSVNRNCMVFLRLVRNCHGKMILKNYETYNRSARVLFSNQCLSQVKFNKSKTNLNRVLSSVNLKLSPAHSVYLLLSQSMQLFWAVRINYQVSIIK